MFLCPKSAHMKVYALPPPQRANVVLHPFSDYVRMFEHDPHDPHDFALIKISLFAKNGGWFKADQWRETACRANTNVDPWIPWGPPRGDQNWG